MVLVKIGKKSAGLGDTDLIIGFLINAITSQTVILTNHICDGLV